MTWVATLLIALAVLTWPGRRTGRAVRAGLLRHRGPMDTSPGPWRGLWARGRRRLGWPGRSQAHQTQQWLPVLDHLSASLRAGLPPADALELALTGVGPGVRAVLTPVLEAAREGRPAAPAWARVARATASPEVELLARSWGISEQLGAPLADAVDSAARALRSRRDLASKLETATAGARTTATILTLLPVAGVGLALLMGIAPATLYGSVPAGASLLAGLVLLAVGRVVVTGMIARATVQR
ncbi:type II secretion system F family protein [Ornithinimicrobium sp. F0845]|uniref:type II secretion system F family protein n=1 Tax=Ornithinimicrobium sp. F0845 TaxID=2926412 RepID=UPI001FF52833|nr:type II secretion system F family protein [Ornithinimicrobium sp. F0845]MCK0113128.1 type II secretion system F family protein [Ornithinimicrobium sp. F0845]